MGAMGELCSVLSNQRAPAATKTIGDQYPNVVLSPSYLLTYLPTSERSLGHERRQGGHIYSEPVTTLFRTQNKNQAGGTLIGLDGIGPDFWRIPRWKINYSHGAFGRSALGEAFGFLGFKTMRFWRHRFLIMHSLRFSQ